MNTRLVFQSTSTSRAADCCVQCLRVIAVPASVVVFAYLVFALVGALGQSEKDVRQGKRGPEAN